MKRILVPTDLSELGDFAFDIAQRLSTSTGAEIHLMSVVTAPGGTFFSADGVILDDDGIDVKPYLEELNNTKEALKVYASNKQSVSKANVFTGAVNDEILDYIKQNEVDMVVMGTHGASGVQEVIIGSHAEHIVRKSPVPVISLKCDRSHYEIKDILFACDFTTKEKVNIKAIKDVAEAFHAKINFLKINTNSSFTPTRKVKQSMRDFAALHEVHVEESNMHIYCDESVEKGIQNFCADTGIDFLAIATHQRRGLARLFNSSISEDIVNHNYQPVMTFPIS